YQYDLAFLVGGYDGVGGALDQAGEVSLRIDCRLLRMLAVGDICPGPDELKGTPGTVIDDRERVEDPDGTTLLATEAVFPGHFPSFDEARTFIENAPSVFWMEVVGPALRIGGHLLRRVSHDRLKILTDIGTGIVASRVRSDRAQGGAQS